MSSSIDYGNLMHRAMRSLIQEVLQDVADNGLPGAHHFFITFDTNHPDAVLAEWLKERYPEEMTVVMQHWYDNLLVEDDGFHVTLNFGDQPEPLYIPFDSLRTFVDPSVEFGLRFESPEMDDLGEEDLDDDLLDQDESAALEEILEEKDAPKEAEVVSLDSFRK
ncbi:SspB family protein [Thalassobius sp. Cn5-15]|uniref:SspB family protein n=1 Tax=Thalassobius sp. Cn5-15 TaxID=2917763 RepID=UPI001EF1929D|nr:ClpXP protease specificity-enhancing factor SspB [Thalassobius sp. Cn5-15]MCG7492657.1 ClpXP protease specificity-enhancing factor SspB [Thalassobius sp. Cn5-15]